MSDGSDGYGGSVLPRSTCGSFTVKGAFVSTGDRISASNGAKVQFASLQEDVHGNGVTLNVDAKSSVEIGTAGGAAAGTITIDAGKTVTEAGTFEAQTIIDNGTLVVAPGASLTLNGALAGSGTASIDAGSTLTVSGGASATDTIAFAGAGGTLDLSGPLGYAGSHIVGFAATETVEFAGAWSLLGFSENAGNMLGTLTLSNGTDQVALNFAGSFSQSDFTINGSGPNTLIGHA